MGLTGDRYVGEVDGHTIELVRNNWTKQLTLSVDGRELASESTMFPHNIELKGQFEHQGARRTVVAHSTIKKILGLPIDADDGVEVDGTPVALKKTK